MTFLLPVTGAPTRRWPSWSAPVSRSADGCNPPLCQVAPLADVGRRGPPVPRGRAGVTTTLTPRAGPASVGDEAYDLMRRLFPLCRSLTGAGVRATFDILEEEIPLARTEIPSGTRVFDWIVPDEWNLREALHHRPGRHPRRRLLGDSTLHVVSYSEPVHATPPAGRAAGAPPHPPRAARGGALPDVVLRADLGLLPLPQEAARVAAGRVRRS